MTSPPLSYRFKDDRKRIEKIDPDVKEVETEISG
jgi:hypothetical protein